MGTALQSTSFIILFILSLASSQTSAQVGQVPQPGLAVFDASVTTFAGITSTALNSGGLPVSSGAPGPYFVVAVLPNNVNPQIPRSTITFTYSSAANNGMVLLTGPANTAVATFPGVGQLDIGLGPLGLDGLPQGIFTLGSAYNTPLSFFDSLLFTNSNGIGSFSFIAPPPFFQMVRFQMASIVSGSVAISNAVDILL